MTTYLSDALKPNTEVALILDVDGVLNRLTGGNGTPTTDLDGNTWQINVDLEMLRALDALVQNPRIQLLWLTTWGYSVSALGSGPFEGLLSGGFVLAARPEGRFVPADWKLDALLDWLDAHPMPYVWADDVDVQTAVSFHANFRNADGRGDSPRLPFSPDPETGLTLENVSQTAAFIAEHTDQD